MATIEDIFDYVIILRTSLEKTKQELEATKRVNEELNKQLNKEKKEQ